MRRPKTTPSIPRSYRGMLLDPQAASPASEAFRVLRTNLRMAEGNPSSLLITSPLSGEGKSITCANLGQILSQNGVRVAIIDADLRLPSQHHLFGGALKPYPPRLARAVGKHDLVPKIVAECGIKVRTNLTLFGVVEPVPAPAELVGSQTFRRFVDEVVAKYDIVLVDSPPVGMVTDAAILASMLDGVLLVLDHGRSQRRVTNRAVDALRRVNADIVGVILNKAPTSAAPTYGYGGVPPARRSKTNPT